MGKPGFPMPLRGGGVGKRGFPTPLGPIFTLAVHAAPPHNTAMNIRLFLGGHSPSQTLLPGGGLGKPGFPRPLREGFALPDPPTGWGDGETRFPHLPA